MDITKQLSKHECSIAYEKKERENNMRMINKETADREEAKEKTSIRQYIVRDAVKPPLEYEYEGEVRGIKTKIKRYAECAMPTPPPTNEVNITQF
jgi:hypothetical protein